MIPFKTTQEQVLRLAHISIEMERAGLAPGFIVAASDLARHDQGVYDLLAMWQEAKSDPGERDELVADIQESIDDYAEAPPLPEKRPYIKYEKLGEVAQQVVAHKAKLRKIIDQNGGVTAVAKKAGIPQPSLSRMLNSASIPRRSTLYRIANALNLPETDVVTEWAR